MRIVFLGDSLTAGRYGGSYIESMRRQYPDHELINAGQGGNTVVNLQRRLESDVLDQSPDGVFVMVGGNDAISYSQPKTRIYYEQAQDIPGGTVTPDLFSQTYRNILETLQLAFIQTWVGLPPAEYSPAVVEAQRHYNQLAQDAARSLRIPTLDLMAHFTPDHIPERPELDLAFINQIGRRERDGWTEYETEREKHGFVYTFDGLHLLPECAHQMAQHIGQFLAL